MQLKLIEINTNLFGRKFGIICNIAETGSVKFCKGDLYHIVAHATRAKTEHRVQTSREWWSWVGLQTKHLKVSVRP